MKNGSKSQIVKKVLLFPAFTLLGSANKLKAPIFLCERFAVDDGNDGLMVGTENMLERSLGLNPGLEARPS